MERRWRRGRAKEAVLPDPVAERVRRWEELELASSGLRMRGMMARWTGVGRWNPNLRHVAMRGGQRLRSAKVVMMDEEEEVNAGFRC